ncbi:MAG: hypothetical protein IJF69_03015 [Clostridia bacterium]|nr:hypothetical protein [Clostridia bacterium]
MFFIVTPVMIISTYILSQEVTAVNTIPVMQREKDEIIEEKDTDKRGTGKLIVLFEVDNRERL